jgi:hypothetical protein
VKIKVLLAVIFVAGVAASLALAKPPKPPKAAVTTATATTHTTTTTTTTHTPKPKCDQVELKGSAVSGTVTFMVTKQNRHGNLVGTQVTLTIPANAKIKAKACTSAGSSALTLRDLHVEVRPTKH